jgi:hypothetical protein
MTFDELVQDIDAIRPHEVRKRTAGYFEFVISMKQEKDLYPVLEGFFGPPFKPRNAAPDKKSKEYSYDYGGIEKHQVFYYAEKNGLKNCALIWPWNNGELATVKLAQGELS